MGDLDYYQAEYQKVCQHYEQLRKDYRELADNQKKLLADRDRLRLQVRAGLLAAGTRVGVVTGDWWAAPPVPTESGSSSFCWYSDTVLHVNKLPCGTCCTGHMPPAAVPVRVRAPCCIPSAEST